MKKLLVWEKQKLKLQGEITAEKEKIKALDRALAQITQEGKEYEVPRNALFFQKSSGSSQVYTLGRINV